jgi:type II secretory pathway component PulF
MPTFAREFATMINAELSLVQSLDILGVVVGGKIGSMYLLIFDIIGTIG